MQCNRDQLLLLAAGELAPDRAAELERHVEACDACATELARLRENLALLDSLAPMEPSGDAVDRIGSAGRDAVLRRRTLRPTFRHRYRYALAVAAAVMAVLGWSLLQSPGLSDAQLDRLWQQPVAQVADEGAAVLDMADQVTSDPWALSADQVLAQIDESEVRNDLLELEESLEQLKGLSWDS
jgi:anti-sigma factor RsiW